MIYFLPSAISFFQGYLLIRLLLNPCHCPRLPWPIFAGGLVGMGLSGLLTFTSLLLFNQIIPAYVIFINLMALALFFFLATRWSTTDNPLMSLRGIRWRDLAVLLALGLLTLPTVIHSFQYPYGEWDAWGCWNLKARFLFLGGTQWTGIFNAAMWHANPSYPLLLPLINVWSWCFGGTTTYLAPLANACLITFLMAGLLYFSLEELTKRSLWPLFATALLILPPSKVILTSSQYSDLIMGAFLLLAFAGFLFFKKTLNKGFLQISILALGLMSFTKNEGLALSIISLVVLTLSILLDRPARTYVLKNIRPILLTLTAAFLATVLFQLLYALNSHLLAKGLILSEEPASLERLKTVLTYFCQELVNRKWYGFWILTALGILLGRSRALRNDLWIFPVILTSYLGLTLGAYWITTFIDIRWWLSVSLYRILFTLTPSVVFWLFATIL